MQYAVSITPSTDLETNITDVWLPLLSILHMARGIDW